MESLLSMLNNFVKIRTLNAKILLSLGDALAHPSPEELTNSDGKVTTLFLPPTQQLFYNLRVRV